MVEIFASTRIENRSKKNLIFSLCGENNLPSKNKMVIPDGNFQELSNFYLQKGEQIKYCFVKLEEDQLW